MHELHSFGVTYEDRRFEDLIVTEDGIVLVDLKSVWEPPAKDREYWFNSDIKAFRQAYISLLHALQNLDDQPVQKQAQDTSSGPTPK